MEKVIEVSGFSKNFGEISAVRGISFEVIKGEMFGLVGPDGAGKSTTIRTLCGLISPDNGEISMFGLPQKKNLKQIQNRLGYLSQKFSLYGDLSIDENINFFARIHGVKNHKEYANTLLSFTRLIDFRARRVERLSGGMKQKAALACSLIHKPSVLFLDEPTTGVDPVSRRDFWKILSDLLKDGLTIFISTPYLDEAERCNRVALMSGGDIISLDTPDKLKESIQKVVHEIVCEDTFSVSRLIKENFSIEPQLFGDRINILTDESSDEIKNIIEFLSSRSVRVLSSRTMMPSLENAFIYLVNKHKPDVKDKISAVGVN
ncbi:MAG: ABC transporter ATP-binding protein [Ignavibacteriaceae bacterium]|nr:ABC transporter ATP-binding protein [Ignavibacteriaceae bacterium]